MLHLGIGKGGHGSQREKRKEEELAKGRTNEMEKKKDYPVASRPVRRRQKRQKEKKQSKGTEATGRKKGFRRKEGKWSHECASPRRDWEP